jgi:hypothetical protein
MSVKFEGKPPFYLGIAEVASAHALDGSVVLRATISVPELRPKSVSVQLILDNRRRQSTDKTIADCRENGRASKAARRLKSSCRTRAGGRLRNRPRQPQQPPRRAESD